MFLKQTGVSLLSWLLLFPAAMTTAQQHPVVELDRVESGPLTEEVPLNGTVMALRYSPLSVPVAGMVTRRAVDTGDQVQQGDLLLELDSEIARLELDRAAAETRQARNRLAEARRLLDEARSVGAGQNIAETEVRSRASNVEAAEAALSRVRANEQRQRAIVERHTLQAPFDGTISERSVDVGQWVTPGTTLFTLVDTAALRLDFHVPQRFFPLLDETARLVITGFDEQRQEVDIITWVPVTGLDARTFLLQAAAPASTALNPGMAIDAVLTLQHEQQIAYVTRDALNRYPEGRVTVWVAESADGQGLFNVTERRVRIAGMAGERVYISEGLQKGEHVVSRGNESLREPTTVELAGQEPR